MTPKWQKLASLAQEISTLWFQFFGAVFASKGYPFKNILGGKLSRGARQTATPVYHSLLVLLSEKINAPPPPNTHSNFDIISSAVALNPYTEYR